MNPYDYIIVGAGSAGCVLANRLSENPSNRILLIEAGPVDRNLLIHMPKGFGKLLADPRHCWHFNTEPEEGNAFTPEQWVRGKVLGGSSSVNGMVYNRGQPEDYDAWEASGCPGWNWKTLLPYFRGMEDHELGQDAWRGAGGLLHVSMPSRGHALDKAAIAAGVGVGMRAIDDLNGENQTGVIGYQPRTLKNGRRWSAARAFLRPALSRPNLTVWTNTHVDRIVFDGRRAIGVECSGVHAAIVKANREVIICAGAIISAKLLQLSGVGPAALLAQHGIPVVHDSPGVGANLREHRVLSMQFRLARAISENPEYRGLRLLSHLLRYLIGRKGLMAEAVWRVGGFFRTREELTRPDAMISVAGFSFDLDAPRFPVSFEKKPGMSCIVYMLRPESTGNVAIRSANPADLPLVRSAYMTNEDDRRRAADIVRYVRRYVRQKPLSEIVESETFPGAAAESDEAILKAWAERGTHGAHAVGTCKMGKDAQSVVDEFLRVRGVERLRVVDGSIFPFMIAGNTNAPIMATALRTADLILGATLSD